MPPPRQRKKPHGQIRQSQVVTTFGPGAMVDLPDHAVIIGGLDHWNGWRDNPIHEERLAAKVKMLLDLPSVDFFAPPPDPDDPAAVPNGITAWQFPEWFIAQDHRGRDEATGVRSRPLVHRLDLTRNKFILDRKPSRIVPVRFVQACTRGHVSDINWRLFVHGPGDECQRSPLWMDEKGTSGDLTAISIRCECGKSKALSAATKMADVPLGFCDGSRPWLGKYGREKCGDANERRLPSRLLVRSASNAYFAQTLSVISIPEADSRLRDAVDVVWTEFLQYCESAADVARERRKPRISVALEGHSDEAVWAEVERRRSGAPVSVRGIREVELETLLAAPEQIGEDPPDGSFFARAIASPVGPRRITDKIERVVKVHRLREVVTQIGFTRFEAAVADVNGELALDVERAPLARETSWLPAFENRGEGLFLALKPAVVQAWAARPAVQARAKELERGFDRWKALHDGAKAKFLGAPYVMLHSLAHLLITAVSLDCGYASSSIRERIYVDDEGYGLMLYTATPDSEGTLGGLVATADRIGEYLEQAISLGRLCANDPVCAHHHPDNEQEERFLLGAACHGCVLLPESSCERRNDFLDRALVVPTVDDGDCAFFADGL